MLKKMTTLVLCAGMMVGGMWSIASAQDANERLRQELREQIQREIDQMRREMNQRFDQTEERLQRAIERALGGRENPQAQPVQPVQPANQQPYLGVRVADVDEGMRTLLDIPADRGVLVREIVENSPAANILKPFDVILTVNGQPVNTPAKLGEIIRGSKPGDQLSMEILRESQKQTVSVRLAARAAETTPAQPNTQPNPRNLREFLDRAYRDGNRRDPEPPAGGMNPFGQGGENPFGQGGENPFGNMEGMQRQMQEFMRRMQENPEEMQGMIERLRDALGRRGNNPFGRDEQNPGQGGNPMEELERFMREMGRENNQPEAAPVEPAPAARPWLGLSGVEVSDEQRAQGVRGVIVSRVVEDGPAAKAGLRAGDVIVRFHTRDIASRDDLGGIVETLKAGDRVKVVVLRDGRRTELDLTLGTR